VTATGTGTAPQQTAAAPESQLLRNRDFLKIWCGETVSLIGTQVTGLALPLVAIVLLQATPLQIGALNASRYIPVVLISLFVGVWLDRRRRRPVLIAANVGRALLVAAIPAAHAFGVLSIGLLCALCLLIGALSVVFDIGLLSYFPSLVERRDLAEANGKIQASASLTGIAGPGLGGFLIGLIGAATLFVDAVSFLVSALMLAFVGKPEPEPAKPAAGTSVRTSVAEGLRTVFGTRMLRSLLSQSATFNLLQNALFTVFVVYAVRVLGLGTTQLGLVVGSMSFGAFVGSFVRRPLIAAVGLGQALRLVTWCTGLAPLLLIVPRDGELPAMVVLMTSHALLGCSLVVYNVTTVSLRQIVTPDRLLARMNASYRLVLFGTIPIGALAGGTLASVAGLRTALIVTAVALMTPILWTFGAPVYALRTMPTGPDEDGTAAGHAPGRRTAGQHVRRGGHPGDGAGADRESTDHGRPPGGRLHRLRPARHAQHVRPAHRTRRPHPARHARRSGRGRHLT
jgi:MFS family permease